MTLISLCEPPSLYQVVSPTKTPTDAMDATKRPKCRQSTQAHVRLDDKNNLHNMHAASKRREGNTKHYPQLGRLVVMKITDYTDRGESRIVPFHT